MTRGGRKGGRGKVEKGRGGRVSREGEGGYQGKGGRLELGGRGKGEGREQYGELCAERGG